MRGRPIDSSQFPTRDVIVVGGGPAGLSAALVLGRCRRSVLVVDAGHPRNAASPELHAYLTRDGTDPLELLRKGRDELARYDVAWRDAEVIGACPVPDGFEVETRDGAVFRCRKLLIATGVTDRLPSVDGMEALYGTSVHHCPFCDGWEERDGAIAVYGRGKAGIELALKLLSWSRDVVLCTHGPSRYGAEQRRRLARFGVPLREERIERLRGENGRLHTIDFYGGASLGRNTLFFTTGNDQASPLPEALGCTFTRSGAVRTTRVESTGVPNLYVAGDASKDMQLAIVAAAEGAKAGVAIHTELEREWRQRVEDEGARAEPLATASREL